jgi:hypothetical protein
VSSEIDLTTLQSVKDWIPNLDSSVDDGAIQATITGFSQYVLTLTGRDSLNSIVAYDEIYDGNGSARMFLRNSPITEVVSLKICGVQFSQSAAYGQGGFFIEQSKRSLAMRAGSGGFNQAPSYFPLVGPGFVFTKGLGNIEVSYKAGYNGTPLDLDVAARKAVAAYYMRRQWIDLASKSMSTGAGTGTTSYRDWVVPPDVEDVIMSYKRVAMP